MGDVGGIEIEGEELERVGCVYEKEKGWVLWVVVYGVVVIELEDYGGGVYSWGKIKYLFVNVGCEN